MIIVWWQLWIYKALLKTHYFKGHSRFPDRVLSFSVYKYLQHILYLFIFFYMACIRIWRHIKPPFKSLSLSTIAVSSMYHYSLINCSLFCKASKISLGAFLLYIAFQDLIKFSTVTNTGSIATKEGTFFPSRAFAPHRAAA